MKAWTVRLLTPMALAALLGGCNLFNKGEAPKGQVIATVDGEEVTLAELQAEMAGAQAPSDPKAAKAYAQAALQRIIARDVLAHAAHDQKLDQTPEYAIQLLRARHELQATLLERKMASEVPPPTRDEAEHFVSDHPTMFAQRALLTIDQVQAQRTNDQALVKALEPLKDLGSAESLLDSNRVPHQRTMTMVDTLRLDPKMVSQIEKLGTSDIFIVNTPSSLTINQVKDTRAVPLTGDSAIQVAMRILSNQRSQDAVSKQAQAIISAAASKVKYNNEYKPPTGGVATAPAAIAPSTGSAPALPTAPNTSQGQPFALGK